MPVIDGADDRRTIMVEKSRNYSRDNLGEQEIHGASTENTPLLETSVGNKFPILPEVPCFLYFVALIIQYPILQFWLFDHFAREYHWKGADNADYCKSNTQKENNTNAAVENLVQSKTNQYVMYTSFVSSFTALFPTLFLGPVTDRFGRKFALFISYLGLCLSLLFTALIFNFNLSPNYLFVSVFILGICGSYGLFLAAVFGMIADVTPGGKSRGFRIATLEASIAIGSSVGSITSGIWVTKIGYVWPMVFSISLIFLASIYTLFIPETLVQPRSHRFSIKTVLDCFQFYIKDTADKRRFKLIICLLCFMVTVWIMFGDVNFALLYLLHQPFCWAKMQTTIFTGVLLLMKWVVVFIFLTIGRCCISSESVFALLGSLSLAGGCLIKGLAQSDVLIFVSAAVQLLSDIVTPMCRTLMSKSVSPTEQGALHGGLSVLHMVVTAFTGIAMSGVYNAGLPFFLGLPYLVLAGFGLSNVILLLILIVHMKRHRSMPLPDCFSETSVN